MDIGSRPSEVGSRFWRNQKLKDGGLPASTFSLFPLTVTVAVVVMMLFHLTGRSAVRVVGMMLQLPLIGIRDANHAIPIGIGNADIDVLTGLKAGPSRSQTAKLKSGLLRRNQIGSLTVVDHHTFGINSVDGAGKGIGHHRPHQARSTKERKQYFLQNRLLI